MMRGYGWVSAAGRVCSNGGASDRGDLSSDRMPTMGVGGIGPGALKMAQKMVATVFPRYSVSRKDRNRLLNLITLLALDDLYRSKVIGWKSSPPPQAILCFRQDGKIEMRQAEEARYTMKQELSDQEIERIVDGIETILDRYGLGEDERATLYTALPCLGLASLQEFLEWNQPPPFDELG